MIKNGTRLQSQVCDTQVIVVKATESLDDLRAGGVPMVPLDADKAADASLDPAFSDGNVMGKAMSTSRARRSSSPSRAPEP